MLGVALRLVGVDAEVHRLEDALDSELLSALARVGERIAAEAKQTHPFQNRTRTLERSIAGVEPTGHFLAGTLVGGVEATAPYAEYVNARPEFEFLNLAFGLVRAEVDNDIQEALDRAARNAGW